MMGGYLVYLNGKLIGDICANELFLKRTPTSDRLLADSELRYPYEGSKTLMHVFDSFDDKSLILELLNGMYAELPEKKPKKAKYGWWNVIPEVCRSKIYEQDMGNGRHLLPTISFFAGMQF